MGDNEENSKERQECVKMLRDSVTQNKNLQFLIDKIEGLGCKLPSNFLICRSCPDGISGGFVVNSEATGDFKPQIVLCDNKKLDKTTFENTIAHELVHALDKCRARLDLNNCLQHACTEIRAASLSGECNYYQEFLRGNAKLHKGHQICAARRAEISVGMNPNCEGLLARKAVDQVLKECYADIYPYEYPP